MWSGLRRVALRLVREGSVEGECDAGRRVGSGSTPSERRHGGDGTRERAAAVSRRQCRFRLDIGGRRRAEWGGQYEQRAGGRVCVGEGTLCARA